MSKIKENIHQAMNNFARAEIFSTTLTENEVNYWLDNYSDTVFCKGRLRQIVFTPVTATRYKVTSKQMFKGN